MNLLKPASLTQMPQMLHLLSAHLTAQTLPQTPEHDQAREDSLRALNALSVEDVNRLAGVFRPAAAANREASRSVRFCFDAEVTDLACLGYHLGGLNSFLDDALMSHPAGTEVEATNVQYRAVGVTDTGSAVIEASFVPDYEPHGNDLWGILLSQLRAYDLWQLPVPLGWGEDLSISDQLNAMRFLKLTPHEHQVVTALVQAADAGTLTVNHLKAELTALSAARSPA